MMSSIGITDMLKLTVKAVVFKYEQNRFTTNENVIVKTAKGAVRGVKRKTIWGDSYFSFERIPYAKPPIGELRFKAPVPADPWDDVIDGRSPAEKPLQSNVLFRKYKGSEDCLYLNVFTKDINPDKPLPVMVWIYGGGFQIGEATRDMYSPDFFMSKNVVLVTIAYRLGPFGFLRIDDPEVNVPGNAGIKDQILSLKWVQENISAFGGDPNNVTLFGESAGGASTHICMISPRSKGLIHKAIVMSGSALCSWAQPPHNGWAYRLAKSLGYQGEDKDTEVYKFLLNTSGPDIVKGNALVLDKEEKHHRILFAFGPVVEPYITEHCILSDQPHEVMTNTWSNEIPMMIGGTSFEGLLFHPEVTRRPVTLKEVGNCKNLLPLYNGVCRNSSEAEEMGLKLKREYFGDKECSQETIMNFLDMQSHREFWHPIYRTILHRLHHSSAPTYVYRFDFDSRDGNAIRNLLCGRMLNGVCHGDDLCYLYHTMFSHRAAPNSPEHTTTKTMIDIWTSFAEKNDPNCEMLGEVKFEPVSREAGTLKCLNISDIAQFITLPELERMKLWNSFYPPGVIKDFFHDYVDSVRNDETTDEWGYQRSNI